MDSNLDKPASRSTRWQYGLPLLFGVVTFVCFASAYPRFVLGWVGLLLGAIVALCVFTMLIYYPVILVANLLAPKSDKNPLPAEQKQSDGQHKIAIRPSGAEVGGLETESDTANCQESENYLDPLRLPNSSRSDEC